MNNSVFSFTRLVRETAVRVAGVVPVVILTVVFFNSTAIAQTSRIAQTEVRLEPAGDTGENDLFGGNVAISANGNTLVVSGQGADSATTLDIGAVFIFERNRSGAVYVFQRGDRKQHIAGWRRRPASVDTGLGYPGGEAYVYRLDN
jgi:FG-GAP repeat